jgi:kumamolisin
MEASEQFVQVRNSMRQPMKGARELGKTNPSELVEVTVRVRRRTSHDAVAMAVSEAARPLGERRTMSRDEYEKAHGADPADLKKVEEYATGSGLTVLDSSAARRSVHLLGTAQAMARAFNVDLRTYQHDGTIYRGHTDHVHVPQDLADVVEAVVGLDNRPYARPHYRLGAKHEGALTAHAGAAPDFTPTQLAQLYNFPDADGTGQVIGIIELSAPAGSGYRVAELQQYFQSIGLTKMPAVQAVSVAHGQNHPGTNPNDPNCADGEVMLDIEVAGAVAPGAKIVVYFAPNTAQGFLRVINAAVHDSVNKPSVISLSWGGAESADDQTTNQINQILQDAAALGVTFCVASGDSGSRDNPNDPDHAAVDFPASSPYALACGGTMLKASGTTIADEEVWFHDGGGSGGGVSRVFPMPSYQQKAGVPSAVNPPGGPGRGVPDICGDADPATGYRILVDKVHMTIGGTSAVAPLWAGLVARLNQKLGKPVGFLNPILYQNPGALNDITKGNNGDYHAGPGWDPCTGLGSPNGAKLLQVLQAPAPKAVAAAPAPEPAMAAGS